ncbi:MAG: hypothetical protein IKN05_02985 [Clostridia bacterium]|nr:hypothetical protein [Clostridia bacterium]
MNAMECLKRAQQVDRQLRALMLRRRRCAELIRATDGAGEKLAALDAELVRQAEDLAALQLRAGNIIDALPDPVDREVMRYRYLDGLNWRDICVRTGFGRTWLWKVHARAEKRLECELSVKSGKVNKSEHFGC